MAFSKLVLVSTFEMVKSSLTMSTMRRPERWARRSRRESAAGIAPLLGRAMPSASDMQAMVEAVPMVLQVPQLRVMQLSRSVKSSIPMTPARTSAVNLIRSVPEPSSRPR